MTPARLACGVLALALAAGAGCDRGQRMAEQAAAQAAAAEQAANEGAAAFDAAVADENWSLAKAQGDVLLAKYPRSDAAARVGERLPEVTARAEAAREDARLAGLWTYPRQAAGDGEQRSAVIWSKDEVDVGGGRPGRVQLVFRDHPEWGRSSYLVLQSGDFDCYDRCRVPVTADDAAPKRMAAYRPDTDEAIAMFIEDDAALWRMARDAGTITIAFPVKAGGTRSATFETGGLDPSRMPW
jgi:hypothetical protein